MNSVKYKPDDHQTVIPYLTVKDAPGLIEFLRQVFGASECERVDRPGGGILHAEVRVGDSRIMLSEACDQMGPGLSHLYVYVEDVDTVHQRALKAGAEEVMAPADMFWGDRFCSVKDTWGNTWSIATHVEDVAQHELAERARAFFEEQQSETG